MRSLWLLSFLPKAFQLFLYGIQYGGCKEQVECLMSIWVGDGDYASVLNHLSVKEGTSRLTVIRMML
jgi:hypothetical protein